MDNADEVVIVDVDDSKQSDQVESTEVSVLHRRPRCMVDLKPAPGAPPAKRRHVVSSKREGVETDIAAAFDKLYDKLSSNPGVTFNCRALKEELKANMI